MPGNSCQRNNVLNMGNYLKKYCIYTCCIFSLLWTEVWGEIYGQTLALSRYWKLLTNIIRILKRTETEVWLLMFYIQRYVCVLKNLLIFEIPSFEYVYGHLGTKSFNEQNLSLLREMKENRKDTKVTVF